jgi:DNA-binding protein HU-beta
MARAAARGKIFRRVRALEKTAGASKKQRKTWVFSEFSLYSARTIPYDANERPQEKREFCFAEAVHGKNRTKFRQVQRRDMAKLTQSQFMKELAAATEIPNKTAKAVVTAYADLAVKETKKSGLCVLPGIGRLVRVDRKARMGRNPATGEAIKIPAKKVVKFRVAKAVKDAIVPKKK